MRILSTFSGFMLCGAVVASPAQTASSPSSLPVRSRIVGAWHITQMGNRAVPDSVLIYTADGHYSVQLMYPKPDKPSTTRYVVDGYEASFGTYDVDEDKHVITHHVKGSISRDLLVGQESPHPYHFTEDGHMVFTFPGLPSNAGVTWEHY